MISKLKNILVVSSLCTGMALFSASAIAKSEKQCKDLPDHAALQTALDAAVAAEDSGLDFDMWATVVNRDGVVCAVAFSGGDRGAQWPGSRVISAQKANTANAFSLDGLALSTANLFSAVQPGGSLFGLQASNPVDTSVAYKGPAKNYGMHRDPMVGKKIGGVNVFGGGLGLYKGNKIVGAIGVSGDTSCADHMIGWRTRANLSLDQLSGVGGVSGDTTRPDNIVYDITPNPDGGAGISAGGFGHPECLNTGDETALPVVQ
ncbi:MAG: heme-binding protein [Gammaproteobacteria bacterium]|nr:MAG: heme-binding protein [Gammaproteobacteria bacterium]